CVLQLNGTSVQPNATRNGFTSCSNPAWAIRSSNTLQTIPFRSSSIRNPWRPQWDMSVNKKFNFTETVDFQFRAEAFNVFNTPHASAVLLDPEFGSDAVRAKASGCGLLLTYEADGFENPRPHRMLALLPAVSVRRLRDLGADAIKILLSYNPDADARANDEKR